MIFTVDQIVAYLSALAPLQPADIISTGTPAGVGMGCNQFLKPGDEVVIEIDGLGRLTNPVVGAGSERRA